MLKFNFLYFLSIPLLIYSLSYLLPYIFRKMSRSFVDKNKLVRIRRIYYAITFLMYCIFMDNFNMDSLNLTDKFGLPKELWFFVVTFMTYVLITILLDTLIISTKDIKSLTKSGISLESSEMVVSSQGTAIQLYEDKIEAEYEIIRELSEYTLALKHKIYYTLKTNGQLQLEPTSEDEFNMIKEIGDLIQRYLKAQHYHIVNVEVYTDSDIHQIQDRFNLGRVDYHQLIKQMEKDEGHLNNNFEFKILCIPYPMNTFNDKIYILLYSKKPLLKREQCMVMNILTCFERDISEIIIECFDALLAEAELANDENSTSSS